MGEDQDEFGFLRNRFANAFPHATDEAIIAVVASIGVRLKNNVSPAFAAAMARRSLAAMDGAAGADSKYGSPNDKRDPVSERDELLALAQSCASLWQRMFHMSFGADEHLWNAGWHEWQGSGLMSDDPNAPVQRMGRFINDLNWAAGALRRAADGIEMPSGRWKQSLDNGFRVKRFQALAYVYDECFDARPTGNNYPSSDQEPTPFMAFCQRIFALIYREHAVHDFARVTRKALRLQGHKDSAFSLGAYLPPAQLSVIDPDFRRD